MSSRPRIVVLGGSGHAKVVLDILMDKGEVEVAGCVTADPNATPIFGLPILGGDDVLPKVRASGVTHAFVAIGENRLRAKLQRRIADLGFSLANAISRHAVLSARVKLGSGIAIMPGAIINVDTSVGDGAIINTGASVDHDGAIGAFAHIGPGSALAGNVTVGEGAFLGAGTTVIPGRTIGAWTVAGAGAVVVRDLPGGVVAVGVPARLLPQKEPRS
jgi:UDP-perosamine 4-acetyltransferase